jgi:predicted transposase YdaD
MKESVIYQDIFQKGEQKGEEKGEQKGEQKGEFKIVNLQLNRRFGEIDSSILERIRLLPTNQLEVLAQELFDFSEVSDLVNWLNQQDNA